MKLRIKILAGAVALLAVAAACGDSSDTTTASTTVATTEAPSAVGTIPEVATEAGTFMTLLAAVDAAGLGETLSGPGPFTVFAPTDDAFAALPEGTVEALLADIPTLTDILLYHVVGADVMAADVIGLETAATVQGSEIAISIVDGKVILNGVAEVVVTDIAASNGTIHVIDAVILPPAA